MRVTAIEFDQIPLRAHSLLANVPLHDIWAIDLGGSESPRSIVELRALLLNTRLRAANPAVAFLFSMRERLGDIFGWDRQPAKAADESFLHKLSADDYRQSLVPPGTKEGPFRVLFVSPREAISEVQNSTVHGFSVFALHDQPSGQRLYWAIYVRSVGRITWWYMRLIDPFRRLIIYPSVLRHIKKEWGGAL